MTTKKIRTAKIVEYMWNTGRPHHGPEFANVYRALIKAGLDDAQASQMVKIAFDAAKGYTWLLPQGSLVQLATMRRNAAQHPNGKDAEDLAALEEGRPSRWGTPEFHSPAKTG